MVEIPPIMVNSGMVDQLRQATNVAILPPVSSPTVLHLPLEMSSWVAKWPENHRKSPWPAENPHPPVDVSHDPGHLPVVHAILSAVAHQQHAMVQLLTCFRRGPKRGPQFGIAKLVQITPISLVFMVDIPILHGENKLTYNWGGTTLHSWSSYSRLKWPGGASFLDKPRYKSLNHWIINRSILW